MATHHRESPDERLALNLRVLRERKELSQAAVADAMSTRGHAWHQQTVARVEAATRPVRFSEAADLAAILETSLDRLTWGSAEANAAEYLYSRGSAVRRSAAAVSEAVLRLLVSREGAERAIKETSAHESPRVASAREDILGALAEYGLEDAVAAGIARRGELAAGAEDDGEQSGPGPSAVRSGVRDDAR